MTINIEKKSESVCQYLGFVLDKRSAMAYPSDINFCHLCIPPNIPSAVHQREFCLSTKYAECPIYKNKKIQPMPKEVISPTAIESSKEKSKKSTVKILTIVLIVLLILVIIILGFRRQIFASKNISPTDVSLATVIEQKPSSTFTLEPTLTPTELLPTLTYTPVAPHMLETPIGTETKLLVHQVADGESLILIAKNYNTTVDAIKAVNSTILSLWAGSLIVIPVDQVDVSAYPHFSVIKIDQDGVTLESLASKYSVDIARLSQYNSLPNDYLFHANEWVLIPINNSIP